MAENIYSALVGGNAMLIPGVQSQKWSTEPYWTFSPINIPDMRGFSTFSTWNPTRHVR